MGEHRAKLTIPKLGANAPRNIRSGFKLAFLCVFHGKLLDNIQVGTEFLLPKRIAYKAIHMLVEDLSATARKRR